MEAVCKWFDPRRGYGFLLLEDETEVFCHFSEIKEPEHKFKILFEGDVVHFESSYTDNGIKAENVIIVERAHHEQRRK